MKRNTVLMIAEILVMGGIIIAFLAPLTFYSDESNEVNLRLEERFLPNIMSEVENHTKKEFVERTKVLSE